jgi:hypothetical protein
LSRCCSGFIFRTGQGFCWHCDAIGIDEGTVFQSFRLTSKLILRNFTEDQHGTEDYIDFGAEEQTTEKVC